MAGGSYPTKEEVLPIGSQAVMCGNDKGFQRDMSGSWTVSATYANKCKEAIKKNEANQGANKYIVYSHFCNKNTHHIVHSGYL